MIKKIDLRNFQCHEKKSLVIGKSHTITGTSNSGKSAIIRALYWAMCNKPRGNAFITHGKKNCLVQVVGDGFKLTRKRGKTNQYILNGKVFEAMGTEVPEEIQDALNINPEINFQLQHDVPFLLSKTPNENGAFINNIAKLTQMQDCLSVLKKRIQAKQDTFRALESERQRLLVTRKESKQVLEIKPLVRDCLSLEELLNTLSVKSKALQSLLNSLCLKQEDPLLKVDLSGAISAFEEVEKTQGKIKTIADKWDRLSKVLSAIKQTKKLIDPMPPEYVQELETAQALQNRIASIDDVLRTITYIEVKVSDYAQKIKEIQGNLKGKVCPLCQSQLP